MRSFLPYKLFALGLTTLGIGAIVYPQLKPVITIVEVDEVAVPEVKVAQAAQPPAPPQTAITVTPEVFRQKLTFASNLPFEEARAMFASHTSVAQQKGSAGTKLASLPAVVDEPKAQKPAVKLPPAQKPAAAAPAKVKLSSANWPQLTKQQKWHFVAGYIKSNNWTCPPSGMTQAAEMDALEKYSWETIKNLGFTNCTQKG